MGMGQHRLGAQKTRGRDDCWGCWNLSIRPGFLLPSESQPHSPKGGFQGLPEESDSNRVGDTLGMKCCFTTPKWSLVGGSDPSKNGNSGLTCVRGLKGVVSMHNYLTFWALSMARRDNR